MIAIILINILCILALGFFLLFIFIKYGKNLLMDITKLYYLVIVIFPLILLFVNVLYLYYTHSSYVFIGLYPVVFPLIYILLQYLSNFYYKRKYLKLSKLKSKIITYTDECKLNVNANDVRIRILPKNRIDIIVNIEPRNSNAIVERALNNFKLFLSSSKEYDKFTFNLYTDEKKSNISMSFFA